MKTVVITGASRGIGHATAQHFLSKGWRVIGTYNATQIRLESPNMVAVQLDLSSVESIERACAEICTLAPTIDVLINNAAIILDAASSKINREVIEKTFAVDVLGPVSVTNELLPALHSGSRIINVDSSYGAFSVPIDEKSSAGYRIAKAGLNMLTRVLAYNLEDAGIIVSSFDPGWVKTDMGLDGVIGVEKPDREPEQPAEELYTLATEVTDTGKFWRFGQVLEW